MKKNESLQKKTENDCSHKLRDEWNCSENDVRFDNLCGIRYLTNVFLLYFLRQCFSIRPATLTIESKTLE